MENGAGRLRRRVGWQLALTLLLLALLVLRVALPTLAETLLEEIASDRLGIELSIDDVDLGLLEGEVAVEGVAMRGVGAAEDLARAGRIALDVDWGALLDGELRAERIAIEAPELFFELAADGGLNWDALGGAEPEEGETPEDGEPGGAFHVASTVFEIGTGVIHLDDRRPSGLPALSAGLGALRLEDLAVVRGGAGEPVRWSLRRAAASDWRLGVTPLDRDELDFSLTANAGPVDTEGLLPLVLNLTREDGIALTVNGSVAPDPLAFDLEVVWEGLSSRSVAPLLLRGAEIERGTARGSVRASLDLAAGPERGLRLSGTVQHDDLVLHVDSDPPIDVSVEHFEGEAEEIWLPFPDPAPVTPLPTRAVWKRIALRSPVIELRFGGEITPSNAQESATSAGASEEPGAAGGEGLQEGATEAVVAAEAGSLPLDLTVAELTLRDGRLSWNDPALGAEAEQSVSGVAFDARGLQWPPATIEHAKLEIGSLGSQPLRVEGPLRADGAELAVRGGGIKLVPWNPLLMYYSDYKVTGGSLSLRSDFKLDGNAYDAPTKVTLKRLRATTDGTGFESTFGIPLSTALSLLSDPSGSIDLELPVAGTLGAGGELRVGVSVVDALREGIMNAITSVITSPLGAAGSLLAKGHDIAFLRIGEAPFEAGATELTPAAKEQLDRAAAFVAKSPDARLALSAEIVAADLDAPGAKAKTSKLLGNLIRGVFASRKELDARTYTLGLELAKARLHAVSDHLVSAGVLGPERIVRNEWDERVAEGGPRVVLRLDRSKDVAD